VLLRDMGHLFSRPLYRDGRLIVGNFDKGASNQGLFSCNAQTMRSLADCDRLPIDRQLGSMAWLSPVEIVGLEAGPTTDDPYSVVACSIPYGECRMLGQVPGVGSATTCVPAFDRVYVAVGQQMRSCAVSGQSGCARINSFGSDIGAFTSLGGSVFAGARASKASIQKCAPDTADSCSLLNEGPYVSRLAPHGDRLLVGTYTWSDWNAPGIGGLYLRPVTGGTSTSVWHGQPGG